MRNKVRNVYRRLTTISISISNSRNFIETIFWYKFRYFRYKFFRYTKNFRAYRAVSAFFLILPTPAMTRIAENLSGSRIRPSFHTKKWSLPFQLIFFKFNNKPLEAL